ncbi:MAG: AAA family ATPase [Clostridia bacterium]|nr:AAA family ATPase [Clostridia bacterium]
MFLESFTLPNEDMEYSIARERMAHNGGAFGYLENGYPCGIFPQKGLESILFDRITIFYGGNGSGKSTLLNVIARKLELHRVSPFNSSELFELYANACRYSLGTDDEGMKLRIPNGSRIITSDDVFDYMLAARDNNEDIAGETERGRGEWVRRKYGDTVKLSGMEDYEELRLQMLARSKTRRQFIHKTVGVETRLMSNGETALSYFDERLKPDTLYLLDEPENSMSPVMQTELCAILTNLARYCASQLVIATHSPFLLALDGARVYDLDADPVQVKPWHELENVRTYYEFFKSHEDKFR